MGKVTKFTGSKLLGSELRRLRGGRSLKQISELSKTPPLSQRVGPVAAPTLSQIENGISFPSLETIHSLAHIYKRPVQQLLDLIVQERLLESADLDVASEGPTLARYGELAASGRWHSALVVAVAGERGSEGAEAIRWRANRAQVLHRLGMAQDAIALLEECLDHPDLPAAQAYQVQQALANCLSKSGLLRSAAVHQAAALEAAPESLAPKERSRMLWGRAYHALCVNDRRDHPVERDLRGILRDLEQVGRELPGESPDMRASLEVQIAWTHGLLGNRLVAVRDLERLRDEAGKEGRRLNQMQASAALASLHARARQLRSARTCLDAAARLAADLESWDNAFDFNFALHELLKDDLPQQAELHLRRCERLYPLLTCRTPSLIKFEATRREG